MNGGFNFDLFKMFAEPLSWRERLGELQNYRCSDKATEVVLKTLLKIDLWKKALPLFEGAHSIAYLYYFMMSNNNVFQPPIS